MREKIELILFEKDKVKELELVVAQLEKELNREQRVKAELESQLKAEMGQVAQMRISYS
jgi:hypothetical protein